MSEPPIVQKGLQPLAEPVKGAVITVSDRCASGEREDLSGPLGQRPPGQHNTILSRVPPVSHSFKSVCSAT
ncbi:hypothetical protein [Actinomyces oricola]